jgi:hypothetical protein
MTKRIFYKFLMVFVVFVTIGIHCYKNKKGVRYEIKRRENPDHRGQSRNW